MKCHEPTFQKQKNWPLSPNNNLFKITLSQCKLDARRLCFAQFAMTLVPEFQKKNLKICFPTVLLRKSCLFGSGDAAKVTNPWSLASTKE